MDNTIRDIMMACTLAARFVPRDEKLRLVRSLPHEISGLEVDSDATAAAVITAWMAFLMMVKEKALRILSLAKAVVPDTLGNVRELVEAELSWCAEAEIDQYFENGRPPWLEQVGQAIADWAIELDDVVKLCALVGDLAVALIIHRQKDADERRTVGDILAEFVRHKG